MNRPDEWKIEQGLHASKLPALDQSGPEHRAIHPKEPEQWKDEAAIRSVGDRRKLFAGELKGWKG